MKIKYSAWDCRYAMHLFKHEPNENVLSEDDEFLSHTAWKKPLSSPTNPRGLA